MAHGLTPDEAIARIADWQGKDVRWEELGGGITNHNYIVWVNGGWGNPGGGKYVLRVPGAGTDMFIDRDVERECMLEAARVGVGAGRHQSVIEPEKAMTIVFVDGEIMHPDTIAGHPDHIRQAVETVKVFHDKAVFGNTIEIFDMLRRYTKVAQRDRRPHARAACGHAQGYGRDRGGARRNVLCPTWPVTTTSSPRTSSSTPTAGCGSSTGSTAA